MLFFRITNPASGLVLGVYTGDSKAEALDSYARDAGYPDFGAACRVTGDDPDDDAGLKVEQLDRAIAAEDPSLLYIGAAP